MPAAAADLVLGIDAGGTKTSAWLEGVTISDQPTGTGLAGPGNPRAVGFEETFRQIELAVGQAFANSGIARASVAGACLCLAGAGRPEEQQRIRDWAVDNGLGQRVRVTGDAEPVLAAASADEVGIALISGTGSFAWGRNSLGQVARAGGWGYLFGDEGSGYAIALAGLRAAAQSADGRTEPTLLLDSFLKALDASRPAELIEKVYGRGLSREQLAGLATCVFVCADSDPVAQRIVSHASDDLAAMVAAVARQLNFSDRGHALALAGGVLQNQPLLRTSLQQQLGLADSQVHVVDSPVRGAVAMARKLVIEEGPS